MKRYILGGLLTAIAMFVWGAVFWMSPVPTSVMQTATDDVALGQALKAQMPASGTYFVPGMQDDHEAMTRLHEAGPVAMIHIQVEGSPAMDPKVFIKGLIHLFGMALLIGWLLELSANSLGSYGRRVGFVVLLGVTASFTYDLGSTIWWPVAMPWALVGVLYTVVNWTIAGLILAAFFKPDATGD